MRLYRRAARALNTFFEHWTGAFCGRCLEVTARTCADDPRAAVELVRGRFAGCCQAGVAETLSVPCRSRSCPSWARLSACELAQEVAFPVDMEERMVAERVALGVENNPIQSYTLRESDTGRLVEGRGCRHLGEDGCRLGSLKAPLCLTYLCTGVRSALEEVAGQGCCGGDEDNFCGSAGALLAVIAESLEESERQVAELEVRLLRLTRSLEEAGVRSGRELLDRWFRCPRDPGRGG